MTDRAELLSGIGIIVMAIAILYGFAAGDFARWRADFLENAWSQVLLVDIYVGFFLFSGWIWFRESSRGQAVLWILLLLLLGNLVSCIYVWRNLRASRGDWRRFWFGENR
ncbi:MAG: DUF1475 family protein [Thermodesulfobacteriota bacterium]